MEKTCDNKSVGVVLTNKNEEILLINRVQFPYGWAAPAGHVDEHGSLEKTAVSELFEEVGIKLAADSLNKVIDKHRADLSCRRIGGDHHIWTVFEAPYNEDPIILNQREVREAKWFKCREIQEIADVTRLTTNQERDGNIIEAVWLDLFVEMQLIK